MIEIESIFLDTSPFIYLIENNPKFISTVEEYIAEKLSKEVSLVTSVITVSEFQVGPKRMNNLKPINDFQTLLNELHFKIFDITLEIAELASTLRANYLFLKSIDALQLSVAIKYNCKSFLTNDIKLKSIKEINVTIINDLI